MLRTYLTLALIAALVLAQLALTYIHGERRYDAGATAERAKWQARDLARQAEIQKLQDERDQDRRSAEIVKARSEARKTEVVRETRKIEDTCADTAVDPGLYSLYTH